jgi:hypothetical protein
MTTSSPAAAITDALATYLRTELRAVAALADSDVVDTWPEPTEDLALSGTRVVVAILRAGTPEDDRRVGGPRVTGVTPLGGTAHGVVTYDYGQVDLPLTLGLWAWSKGLRDDVDEVLHGLLNRPYWTTVHPIVSTIATGPIAAGEKTVAPASMAGIWPRTMLRVGGVETVRVASVTPTTFAAVFAANHAAGATLVEVPARRRNAANGLHLRAPLHHELVARYDFGSPRTLDDAEGGRGAQRQEWRSICTGTGSIRHVRAVTASLQKSASIACVG